MYKNPQMNSVIPVRVVVTESHSAAAMTRCRLTKVRLDKRLPFAYVFHAIQKRVLNLVFAHVARLAFGNVALWEFVNDGSRHFGGANSVPVYIYTYIYLHACKKNAYFNLTLWGLPVCIYTCIYLHACKKNALAATWQRCMYICMHVCMYVCV